MPEPSSEQHARNAARIWVWAPVVSALIVADVLTRRGALVALSSIDHTYGLLIDFDVYVEQARALLSGSVMLHDGWLYPPFAAVTLMPLGWLDDVAARVVFSVVQAGLCAWLVFVCRNALASYRPIERWSCAIGLALSSLPVLHCLKWGQLSVLVLALAVFGLCGRGRSWVVLLGLAASLKLYAAAYAMVYVARGERRALVMFAGSVLVASIVVPFVVLSPEVISAMWYRVLASVVGLSSVAGIASQSLPSLAVKWLGGASWVRVIGWVGVAGVCAVTYLRARAHRDDGLSMVDVASFVLCATLALEPAWVHYFVCLPIAQAVLLEHAGERRVCLGALGVSLGVSAIATIVSVYDPSLFFWVQRAGLVTVAGLACLVGLWRVERVA